jgi:MFS superfamily sulfate permease-like transporter
MELTLFEERWLPKSVLCLRHYTLNKFLRDLVAGITVGLVALPLAMAFAIASGLSPQAGIYGAVVTGFLRNMTALDATGLFALEEMARTLKKSGRALILCGAREQPLKLIQQTEFEELVGLENICDNVQDALRRAEEAFERLAPIAKATAR